jgi:acyl carrier protein
MEAVLNMENKLIEFIKCEFALDNGFKIKPNTKLISAGIINPFSQVSLQLCIKKEFDKNITDPKMTMENCETVDMLIFLINGY